MLATARRLGDPDKLTVAILTGADLDGARWREGESAPEGWERDTSSGLLKRAGTGSKPAGAD
jgi:hypothetical protein